MAGILPLLVGSFGGLFSIGCWVRHHVAPRRRNDDNTFSVPVADSQRVEPPAASPAREERDGRAFERSVAGHFRMHGYRVEETGTHGRGGDRGVDLVMRRPDAPEAAVVCVQCKDYAAWKVGAEAVRAFAGAVALRGPGHVGWVVISGRFTVDAIRDAAQLKIRLIDGDAWASMTRATGTDALKASITRREGLEARPTSVSSAVAADVPLCPLCRTPMVRREPKPGGKQFRPFWGCRSYPQCRATVDIA
jgi:restriction system protein